MYSFALRTQNANHQAMRVTNSVVERTSDPAILSIAWNELGVLHLKLGEFAQGITCFRRAIHVHAKCGPAPLNLLSAGLQAELPAIVREGAEQVETRFHDAPYLVEEFVSGVRKQKQLGRFKRSLSARSMCDLDRMQLGPLAMQVASALC